MLKKLLIGMVAVSCSSAAIASAIMDGTESQVVRSTYNLDSMIENIKQLRKEGKRLGLFWGRSAAEPLPTANDDALFPEDNGMIWVSGDKLEETPPANRLHVIMDFNDDDKVRMLNNLFDKVVVDLSTWKYLNFHPDPVERFSKLLVKSPTSTLVFESDLEDLITQMDGISEPVYGIYTYTLPASTQYSRQRNEIFSRCYHEVNHIFHNEQLKEERARLMAQGMEEFRKIFTDDYETDDIEAIKSIYISNVMLPPALKAAGLPEKDPLDVIDHESIVRTNTIAHLKTIFNQVELRIKAPFYTNTVNPTPDYFIATDPK